MNREQYNEQMEVIIDHSGSRFVMVMIEHVQHLKGDGSAAIVLSHLINLLTMRNRIASDRRALMRNGLWFECPAGDLQNDLNMTEHRQRRTLKTLVKFKLIETERRAGNVLWVRINTEELKKLREKLAKSETRKARNRNAESEEPMRNAESEEPTIEKKKKLEECLNAASDSPHFVRPVVASHTLEDLKPKQSSVETSNGTISYKNSKNKDSDESSGSSQNGHSSETKRIHNGFNGKPVQDADAKFVNWAERLHAAAEKHSGRKKKFSKVSSSAQFKAIFKRIGESQRIEKALSFYENNKIENSKGGFLIVWNPVHFDNALDWIESCIARTSNGHTPQRSQFFDKRTKEWFGNLPYEYDHPTKDGVVVKLYSSGLWYEHFHITKDGEKLSTRKRHDANEGDFPPPPPP